MIVFTNQSPPSDGGDSDGESGQLRLQKKKTTQQQMKPRQWFDPGQRERELMSGGRMVIPLLNGSLWFTADVG